MRAKQLLKIWEEVTVDQYSQQFKKLLGDQFNTKAVTDRLVNSLKKHHRIQWAVRWIVLAALRIYSNRNEEMKNKYLAYVRKISNKSGRSESEIISELDNYSMSDLLGQLEHYFSSNTLAMVPKIEQYTFQWQFPSEVLRTFKTYENEARAKIGGEDLSRLIREEEEREEEGEVTELLTFPNGWKWVNLNTNKSNTESESGGHCGECEDSHSTLLSLRRPVQVGDEIRWRSELTAELSERGKIIQLRHENEKPGKEYHPYILDLLLKTNLVTGFSLPSFEPEDIFKPSDLSSEDLKKLERKMDIDLRNEYNIFLTSDYGMYDPVVSLRANNENEAFELAEDDIRNEFSDYYKNIAFHLEFSVSDENVNEYEKSYFTLHFGEEQTPPPCINGQDHDWSEPQWISDLENSYTYDIEGEYDISPQKIPYVLVCPKCGNYKKSLRKSNNWPEQYVYEDPDEASEQWSEDWLNDKQGVEPPCPEAKEHEWSNPDLEDGSAVSLGYGLSSIDDEIEAEKVEICIHCGNYKYELGLRYKAYLGGIDVLYRDKDFLSSSWFWDFKEDAAPFECSADDGHEWRQLSAERQDIEKPYGEVTIIGTEKCVHCGGKRMELNRLSQEKYLFRHLYEEAG